MFLILTLNKWNKSCMKYTLLNDVKNEFGEIIKRNIFSAIKYKLFVSVDEIKTLDGRILRKGNISLLDKMLIYCFKKLDKIINIIISSLIASILSNTKFIRNIIELLF